MTTPAPQVDAVIAVHSPDRPVARAVGSLLRNPATPVRVTVVCHGTDREPIAHNLSAFAEDPRLRFLQHADGVRSPSGPFNAGLDAATAPFTSIMGSDDELAPGAMDSWLALQRRDSAAVVLPRLAHATGIGVATPPTRPFRNTRLDGIRDRLLYRSAPLGLVSRAVFGHLRLSDGLSSGGDVAYAAKLWLSGERISFDIRGPAYLIHDDAGDRVTFSVRPVAEELRFLADLLQDSWVAGLSAEAKRAFAIKLVRIHLFGAVFNRRNLDRWGAADRVDLEMFAQSIISLAPGCLQALSQADRAVLDGILNPDSIGTPKLVELAEARRRFGRPETVLTRSLAHALDRESPLRMMAASWLVQRRASVR